MPISPFLDVLNSVGFIKQVETYLPIVQKQAVVTPLVVGDDVSLRTSVVSPINYDRELCRILANHTMFTEEDGNKKLSSDQLSSQISNIDKLSLMWALYKATYDNLSDEREIKCDNENCSEKIKVTIPMDDLIHEDTYKVWDKELSFLEYRYVIKVENGDVVYEFYTKLPSMKDNNRMLGALSVDVLQHNLTTLGTVFSRSQNMALLVDSIKVYSKSDKFAPVVTNNLSEILISFEKYLPYTISQNFFEQYNEHFGEFIPNFYYNVKCPSCGHTFKYKVDLEVEFFRRTLYS